MLINWVYRYIQKENESKSVDIFVLKWFYNALLNFDIFMIRIYSGVKPITSYCHNYTQ